MTPHRRGFIAQMAAAAGAAALAPKLSLAAPGRDPIAGWTVVNALGELSDINNLINGPAVITPRMLADAHASGQTAANITLGYTAGDDDPFESTVADVAHWQALVRAYPNDLLQVLTTADIARAKAEKKIGLIFGFQNCAMLGDKVARIELFKDMGVRVFQLTYNPANKLGGGSMAPPDMGLTRFGHEVVERLNAAKVMVDLSHSNRQICLDAIKASKQPISITHTGCQALNDLPRNKTDEELRLVAQSGGFVGIYFMLFLAKNGAATGADVVAHIEHAINVCGEDHVGIGTDGGTTGVDDLAAYDREHYKEYEDRKAKGVAAPGETALSRPFVAELRGPDQFRKLAGLLAARGHKSALIEKILGRNFVRYAKDVWGA